MTISILYVMPRVFSILFILFIISILLIIIQNFISNFAYRGRGRIEKEEQIRRYRERGEEEDCERDGEKRGRK